MLDADYFTLPRIMASDALRLARTGELTLVDLRKPEAVAASGRRLPGAEIRDPFELGHGDPLMLDDRSLAVFCVHGHEVSQFGCAMLLLHGRRAFYVTGGFEALCAAGAETVSTEGAE